MSRKISANGVMTNYRIDGPEGGPVIVMSNSLMTDLTMWEPQVAVLSSTYRVLRYDTRGHGATEAPAGRYSIEALAEDVKGLLDALDIERAHYVGLSLGGFIGQQFAATHGDRLISATLCDTTASQEDKVDMWEGRIRDAEQDGLTPLIEPALKRWFTPSFHESSPDAIDGIRKTCHQVSAQGYIGCCGAIADMDLRHLLADIKVPTLLMVGEQDPSTSVDKAQYLHDNIKGSEMFVIPNAAHLSNFEQPGVFNENLMAFLERCEATV